MPNPRLPSEVADITGASKVNPSRYRDHARPKVKSLGPAPKRFTDDQRAIWDEFNSDFPWLGRSDRALVEVATNLMEQMRSLGADAPVSLYAQIRMVLGQMGGTPVDRSKVIAPDGDKPEDPADEFLQ